MIPTHVHWILWNVEFLAGFAEKPTEKPTEKRSVSVSVFFGFILKTDRNRPKPTDILVKNRKTDRAIFHFRFTTLVTSFIAQFATHQETLPKLDSTYKSRDYDKKIEKNAFLRCPAKFWEFRSEKLTPHLNSMSTQTESRAFFFFVFSRTLWTFFFFRIFISAISLGQQKKNGPAFYLLICA